MYQESEYDFLITKLTCLKKRYPERFDKYKKYILDCLDKKKKRDR